MKRIKSRPGTNIALIAEKAYQGLTKLQCFDALRPLVEEQVMVYKRNRTAAEKAQGLTNRVPKPMAEQLRELKFDIGRVYAKLGKATSSDFESEEIDTSDLTDSDSEIEEIDEEEEEEESDDSTEEESDVKRPKAGGKIRLRNEWQRFMKRVEEIRKFCADRAEVSEPIDSISMRPLEAGSKLIPRGIPCDALLHAMTLDWPKDARRDVGISDYDVAALSAKIMAERNIDSGGKHALFGYALLLAEARQPIMLIGPAGSGKSHLAKQLAVYMAFDYSETPMSPGATRGDLLGRHTLGGFVESEFEKRYGSGGFFNFEEIDASDSSMLIVLNNALAGKSLYNSTNGTEIKRHPDFVAVATANTFGTGANRDFTGRERLDSATLDRWRMGRMLVEIDAVMEKEVFTAAFENNLRTNA